MMTERSAAVGAAGTPAPSRWPIQMTMNCREAVWGYVFISPWIIGFVVFSALPMLASLVLSLTNFDPRRPDEVKFIGLENYFRMTRDPILLGYALGDVRFALLTCR